jgi:hypothetical protein
MGNCLSVITTDILRHDRRPNVYYKRKVERSAVRALIFYCCHFESYAKSAAPASLAALPLCCKHPLGGKPANDFIRKLPVSERILFRKFCLVASRGSSIAHYAEVIEKGRGMQVDEFPAA